MTSISSQPAVASPAATAPTPPDGAAPASEPHAALVALVRMLARQVVREWVDAAAGSAAELREEGDCR